MASSPIVTRDLTPALWPELERLFGPNGGCAGCWCMWWRLEPGERITVANGPAMKRRQKALVQDGASRGVLAFVAGEPVGWCAYGRKQEFAKLQRSRTLATADAAEVFSIPCFFVKPGFRGRGVARALLRHALASIREVGGRVAEAYPVRPPATNAAAYTGTVPFLEAEGFVTLTTGARGKQRARRMLQGERAPKSGGRPRRA
jgi:GNAT superfamily N-acetyltransferase